MRKLRTFKRIGTNKCIACNRSDPGVCFLIPSVETEEGHNCKAVPMHLHCLQLVYASAAGVIYQHVHKRFLEMVGRV